MSELPDGIPAAEEPEPRASACAIILRRCRSGWKVLLGLRSHRSKFMPGHLAFPGGAVDPSDGPERPGSLLRCVRREVREETGLELDSERWFDAGCRVTPPLFPVRFRTAFYVCEAPQGSRDPVPPTGEFEFLEFRVPGTVLRDWAAGRCSVPPPLLPLLRLLSDHASGPAEQAERIRAANAGEESAPRIEFAPQIWMLPVRTATMPPATHTNVWIPGGKQFAIVDPGSSDPPELRRLERVLRRRSALGHRPTMVLLTHGHRDHAGGAVAIARELNVPIRAHDHVLERLAGSVTPTTIEAVRDGETIQLEGMALRARHTPGHAPGHLAFEVLDRAVLIAGDLISGLSTILIDPDHGDMGQYLDSLTRMRDLDCKLLLPGHGPPLPGKALQRLLEHRAERERRIVEQMRAPETALSAIARGAYADVPRMPPALTERQTLSHLIRLERCGRVRRTQAAGGSWSPSDGGREEDR